MGFVVPLIPYIIAAVGTAATIVNQRNVAHKQDQELASQIRAQGQKQQLADARTATLIQSQKDLSDAPDKAKSQAAYNKDLALKAPQSTAALQGPAAASAAYAKDKSDAALGVAQYGNQQADWLSSIQAPGMSRQRNIIENIDPYRNDIGLIARNNQGDNFLSNMRLRGIRPNAGLSLIAGIAGGASSAMAAGGYGAGSGTQAAAAGDPYAADYMAPNLVNNLPKNPWMYQ